MGSTAGRKAEGRRNNRVPTELSTELFRDSALGTSGQRSWGKGVDLCKGSWSTCPQEAVAASRLHKKGGRRIGFASTWARKGLWAPVMECVTVAFSGQELALIIYHEYIIYP